jgi:hypothetical protein
VTDLKLQVGDYAFFYTDSEANSGIELGQIMDVDFTVPTSPYFEVQFVVWGM